MPIIRDSYKNYPGSEIAMEEKKQKGLGLSISEQRKLIEELEDRLAKLRSKLEPIMEKDNRPEVPNKTAEQEPSFHQCSVYNNCICENNLRVGNLITNVNNLLDCIDF